MDYSKALRSISCMLITPHWKVLGSRNLRHLAIMYTLEVPFLPFFAGIKIILAENHGGKAFRSISLHAHNSSLEVARTLKSFLLA